MVRDAWAMVLGNDRRFKIMGCCADGTEAIKMCRKLKPDILLLYINMSPLNGIDAVRKIRKFSPETGIIALTMYNDPTFEHKSNTIF